MKLKKIHLVLLSVLSAILYSLPLYAFKVGPVLFIALVPLLMVENHFYEKRSSNKPIQIFYYTLFSFLLVNIISIWGVVYTSITGFIILTVASAFFMALTFYIFHRVKRRLGPKIGGFAFIIFWLSFEYIYTVGEISFPLYTLGNGFAFNEQLVQWYEYTGVFGGSFWVLISNLLLFIILQRITNKKNKTQTIKEISIWAFVILAPMITSLIMYYTYEEKKAPVEIILVQPNINPYTEKFDPMSLSSQMEKIIMYSTRGLDEKTDFIVAPETAIPVGLWIDSLEQTSYISQLREAISDYPNVNLIIGVNTMKMYSNAESASATAHKFGETGKYYDYYNSAIMLNDVDSIPIYHKSKLVIGPEKMPYNQVFKFLEDLMMDNGGFVGSNGLQEEREVFFSNNGKAIAAPIICYEAVFGEYIGDYIKKGANFFAVITNDGWWFNAPIYLQSLGFGKLRAIEHRRSIARSANTGISCFIDQRGSMYKEAKYSTAASIKGTLNLNNELTFYTKTGDYIPKIAIFFSILILLQALVSKLKQKSLKEQ